MLSPPPRMRHRTAPTRAHEHMKSLVDMPILVTIVISLKSEIDFTVIEPLQHQILK